MAIKNKLATQDFAKEVLYAPATLTPEQKAQAQKNIGMPEITAADAGLVLGVSEQGTWELSLVTGGGGGEGVAVQSDWNVTDETSAAYIKNKPFYSNFAVTPLLENATVTFQKIPVTTDSKNLYAGGMESSEDTVSLWNEGFTSATVIWDGVTYECTPFSADGMTFIGNECILTGVDTGGEPFALGFISKAGSYSVEMYSFEMIPSDGSELAETIEHTVSVSINKYEIVKIPADYLYQPDWNVTDETDSAYIKNKPFGEIKGEIEIHPLTQIDGFAFQSNLGVYVAYDEKKYSTKIGETYIVHWDGVDYECINQDASVLFGEDNAALLGNASDFGFSGNNEPFIIYIDSYGIIYASLTDTEDGGSHTVGIKEIGTVIQKLDNKYLNFIETTMKEIIPDSNITFEWNGTDGYWQMPGSSIILTANQYQALVDLHANNKKVNVEFDDVEYSVGIDVDLPASQGYGAYIIGDASFESAPFVISVFVSDHSCKIFAKDEMASIDTAITKAVHVYADKRDIIKPEHLPDNIGGSSGPALPTVTTEDAGKFLRVTDEGVWAAVSIPNAEGVGF